MNPNHQIRLEQCINSIVEKISQVIERLQKKKASSTTKTKSGECSDFLLENAIRNIDVNTFSVDDEEVQMFELLTNDIQNMLRKYLPSLPSQYSSYICQNLYFYQFDEREKSFSEVLTPNLLHSLRHTLKGLLAASRAYPAAYDGVMKIVADFLKKYPEYKDKPGFWGTTLLYSAAKRNHLSLVKFLVETFNCSVNAQNQCELDFLLIDEKNKHVEQSAALAYTPDPKLASTPLHAACFNNNLEIVKYLIENGANYFLNNQYGETPIKNGEKHENIQKFFRQYLIFSYINPSSTIFPTAPILECYDRKGDDCIWEFKPIRSRRWEEFTKSEQKLLSNALNSGNGVKPFQSSTYLNVRQGIYNVNILIFLRSARSQDPNPKEQDSSAWIRCRGSSVANFDMYCVWQMMFVKYDINAKQSVASSAPSLNAGTLPSVYESQFPLKLNSWYTCDSKRSTIFDNAMNYRRRYIDIDCNFDMKASPNKIVKCNLYEFQFANENKTILGHLRWIPKLMENIPNDRNVMKVLDNFKISNDINPIPLTINRMEKVTGLRSTTVSSLIHDRDDDAGGMFDWESRRFDSLRNDENMKNDREEKKLAEVRIDRNQGTWTLADLLNGKSSISSSSSESIDSIPDTPDIDLFEFIKQRVNQIHRTQRQIQVVKIEEDSGRTRQETDLKKAKQALENEVKKLKYDESILQKNLDDALKLSKEQKEEMQQQIEAMKNDLKQLKDQIERENEEQERIERTAKQIETLEYTIPGSDPTITINFDILKNILMRVDYPLKFYFNNQIPTLELNTKNSRKIALRGLPKHHEKMKEIFEGIERFLFDVELCKQYYNTQNQKRIRSISAAVFRSELKRAEHWKTFSLILKTLINDQSENYVANFGSFLSRKATDLMYICLKNPSQNFEETLKNYTDSFIKSETFLKDMDGLKLAALNEFIDKHILFQVNSNEKKVTQKSAHVLNEFIEKIRQELNTSEHYAGYGSNNLKNVATLLKRLMIYYRCFLTQLPLFNESIDLLNQIESKTVTTISTVTGSGKSTLLPPLLAANGYARIFVTQPRRLPCTLLSKHVNTMMDTNISGWQVSGDDENKNGQILYLTDGLLKEQLLNDDDLIGTPSKATKGVVFFIDEVHERSINIDLCLALFARLLTVQPQIKTKMKLIISSATLDPSVPALFKRIPNCSVAEFNLASLSRLHPVTKHHVPGENIIDLVQNLYTKLTRNDQILCFVSSKKDVDENCELLKRITCGTVVASPLVQSQSAIDQQEKIQKSNVFFSTTVAETSLTFPNLKYVIDTGLINTPVYKIELQRTILDERKCAESTTKQRLGRLGRTQPGEYYALYDFSTVPQDKYPKPQICQSDLMSIEFALRKSPLKTSLKSFQQFLPQRPEPAYIDDAINQLISINLIESSANDRLTKLGVAIADLPDFGSLSMAKAVHAAFEEYRCGFDLIILSSILSVCNISSIFKLIPANLKADEGDFMTLIEVMNQFLKAGSVPPNKFDINRICMAKGLAHLAFIIKPAIRRYQLLDKALQLNNRYKEAARIQSNNWELIAKALLKGFSDHVYVSLKTLQGKTRQYVKYSARRYDIDVDKQDSLDQAASIATIDRSSTLKAGGKQATPFSIVLARDIRYSSAIRSAAILSFVGVIDSSWLEYVFTRELKLNANEEKRLKDEILNNAIKEYPYVNIKVTNSILRITGQAGQILAAELFIRAQLTKTVNFKIEPSSSGTPNENLTRNLKSITSMPDDLFGPLRWRWDNDNQVTVRTKMNKNQAKITVTVKGLESQIEQVQKEFETFRKCLAGCAVIRHPNAGVSPRVLKSPLRDEFKEMEARINRITNPERTGVDIWKALKGPTATRTTRMEVVAWVAVCKFYCRLEGGFVRDWVVGGYSNVPQLPMNQWVEFKKSGIPKLHPELIPADLDCHLPPLKRFDIEAFLDDLYGYEITAQYWREDWRYVLLIDKDSIMGPFMMDLIEPHIALTHDRIDFDVSNLSLEREYTKDLGMRVDITAEPRPIHLETIVENIRNKKFQVLRPIDGEVSPTASGRIAERVEKMIRRGWEKVGETISFIPNPPSYEAFMMPYPSKTILYENIVTEMSKIGGARVISIEQIKNPIIENLYENMKRSIEQECPNNDPIEQELFHGTGGEAIAGIISRGFDDRYFSPDGRWGRGAYFANDPIKSDKYAYADPNTKHRVIFYTKVLLGIISEQKQEDSTLVAAPIGHHSVHGTVPPYDEYVVYRYGQALPYLKITYKK